MSHKSHIPPNANIIGIRPKTNVFKPENVQGGFAAFVKKTEQNEKHNEKKQSEATMDLSLNTAQPAKEVKGINIHHNHKDQPGINRILRIYPRA